MAAKMKLKTGSESLFVCVSHILYALPVNLNFMTLSSLVS